MAQALGPAVSLAVAAVPEGLPFVATAAELATARRLSRRGALVRNPSTIEALGRVDMLCFDKTGTLTEGRLRLRHGLRRRRRRCAGRGADTAGARRRRRRAARQPVPSRPAARLPHPTDRAIIRAAGTLEHGRRRGPRDLEACRRAAVRAGAGLPRGARPDAGRPGRSASRARRRSCWTAATAWAREEGITPFDARAREKVEQEMDRLARLGYRVLAVAEREASGRQDLTESRIDRLCLLGLVVHRRPGTPDRRRGGGAAAQGRRRRHDDHRGPPDDRRGHRGRAGPPQRRRIMTGPELDALDDEELAEALPGSSVFARVSPAQKARVVQALRGGRPGRRGHRRRRQRRAGDPARRRRHRARRARHRRRRARPRTWS